MLIKDSKVSGPSGSRFFSSIAARDLKALTNNSSSLSRTSSSSTLLHQFLTEQGSLQRRSEAPFGAFFQAAWKGSNSRRTAPEKSIARNFC